MQTLAALIDALPRHGNRRATGFAGPHGARWWTYRQLHAMVHRAARVFDGRGIARGQRILLHAANSPEWVAFFLGAILRGIVVVPVDANASMEQLLEIARLTEAVFLIDEQNDPRIGIPRHDLHDLGDPDQEPMHVPIEPEDAAAILFTSGSTGAPRGVILSHANLMQQAAPFLRLRTPLRLVRFRLLALSPLSHVQGLVLGLVVPLSIGLIVLYSHSVSPPHLVRTIRTSRIRFLSTVPRILDLLEQELRATTAPHGGMLPMARAMGRRFRVILVGGATLPAEREAFWRASGVLVVQGLRSHRDVRAGHDQHSAAGTGPARSGCRCIAIPSASPPMARFSSAARTWPRLSSATATMRSMRKASCAPAIWRDAIRAIACSFSAARRKRS